jgi:hypothetical protein
MNAVSDQLMRLPKIVNGYAQIDAFRFIACGRLSSIFLFINLGPAITQTNNPIEHQLIWT